MENDHSRSSSNSEGFDIKEEVEQDSYTSQQGLLIHQQLRQSNLIGTNFAKGSKTMRVPDK